jgi:pantoate kinase
LLSCALTQVAPVEGALPPGTGLAVYAGYAVITLLAAALVLRRRDA